MNQSTYRILLVDDEEGIRFTLGCLLKKEGFQVDVAATRAQGIHFMSKSLDPVLFLERVRKLLDGHLEA